MPEDTIETETAAPPVPFHTQLKAARLEAHLSQQQMANHIEVSRVTYNRWENGHTPPSGLNVERLHRLFPDIDLPAMPAADFASALKNARVTKGLTQEQLAVAVGVTRDTIWDYENERSTQPRPEIVARLEAELEERLSKPRSAMAPQRDTDRLLLLRGRGHVLVDAVFKHLDGERAKAWLETARQHASTLRNEAKSAAEGCNTQPM